MTGDGLQLAGVLVQARTDALDAVARRIRALRGARIHAATPDGKLVVTLEAATGRRVLARLSALREMAGVLSASLVYEHTEPSRPRSDP